MDVTCHHQHRLFRFGPTQSKMAAAAAAETVTVLSREPLFEEVCSVDFLKFKFGGRGYQVGLLLEPR
jgi:hypothetical protein